MYEQESAFSILINYNLYVHTFVEEIRTENLCRRAFVNVYQKALINSNNIFNNVLTN